MSESDQDRHFIARARALLDAAAGRLDTRTALRLRAARTHALQSTPHRGWRSLPAWLSAGGLAAVALAVWFSWHGPTPPDAGVPHTGIEDVDILVDAEGPDFYDDLDFYDWLNSDAQAG